MNSYTKYKNDFFACSGSWPNPTESLVEEKASSTLNIHCKKGYQFSHPQPGKMSLPMQTLPGRE